MNKHIKFGIMTGLIADLVFIIYSFGLKSLTGSFIDPKRQFSGELLSINNLGLLQGTLWAAIIFVIFFIIGITISYFIDMFNSKKKK